MAEIPMEIAPYIRDALAERRPVVALESTIITHGMPYPENIDTARRVEQAVRDAGALPATIAILGGRIHVGLNDDQLQDLSRAKGVRKLSRADLAACLTRQETGSTTVAATMICAHLAGIAVFATGGIGGVHRGAEHSFDVSADLHELSRTPVTVVCAGPKAILDIDKTLEVLETLGVPVITHGADAVPAFWSRDSGRISPLRMDSAAEIARAHRMRAALGLSGGQLVANPVPQHAEIPLDQITPLIDRAIDEARAAGISAKEVTPHLLDRMLELTKGRSLATNVDLVLNNADLATQIAIALCKME